MEDNEKTTSQASPEELLEDNKLELEKVQLELKEIDLLLEQSVGEVEKLTQRNASISAHLQQVQSQIENTPVEDIRVAYDAALEAQQRLAVMRGQLEKLRSDREHVHRISEILDRVRVIAENNNGKGSEMSSAQNSIEIMTQAQEAERQRLSRQMHDGPAQALSNFILQTEIAMRLFEIDQDQAQEELINLKKSASKTFQKVRDFIFDLRPMMLDDLGLVPTIKRYAESYSEKSNISVPVGLSGSERRLESYIEVVIFRAIQELLSAKSLHEEASEVKVQLDIANNEVRASLEDNGRGFDINAIPDEALLAIKAIQERMEMLGGSFDIDATIGAGSKFTFSIPIDDDDLIG